MTTMLSLDRIERSDFCYVNANSNVTYHIGIYLFPSMNPVSNAKRNEETHRQMIKRCRRL